MTTPSAFDKAGVPKQDDGIQIGTLDRLDRLLARTGIPEDARREVLKPFREVRAARQKPAHVLRANVTDKTFMRKQAELLQDVITSLELLRGLWQRHPANGGWSAPEYAENGKRYWL